MGWEIPVTDDRAEREALVELIRTMPAGWRVFVAEPVHTPLQRKKFNAMCNDLARQVLLFGEKVTPVEMKHWLVAAWRQQTMLPGWQAGTLIFVGEGLGKKSKPQAAELIELAYAFGAQQDPPVVWSKETLQLDKEGNSNESF